MYMCVCVCICSCFTLINDVVYMYLSYCNAVNCATLLCTENFHGRMISLEFARKNGIYSILMVLTCENVHLQNFFCLLY